jgi:integrase
MTYLFPPLRQQFFSALRHYLEQEFIPAYVPGQSKYLFQYVEPKLRGQPLVNASDAALNKPLKAAAARAGIPGPVPGRLWTLHSLRHLYGVYMLNDYPIAPAEGRFGIPITDVQMLMGHKLLRTTEKYARPKTARLVARLEASDRQMLGMTDQERELLPCSVANSLLQS